MKARLDTRVALYGEKRLTDPQVRLLRALAADEFDVLRHDARTMWSLERLLLIAWQEKGQPPIITAQGIALLAKIDAAGARSDP